MIDFLRGFAKILPNFRVKTPKNNIFSNFWSFVGIFGVIFQKGFWILHFLRSPRKGGRRPFFIFSQMMDSEAFLKESPKNNRWPKNFKKSCYYYLKCCINCSTTWNTLKQLVRNLKTTLKQLWNNWAKWHIIWYRQFLLATPLSFNATHPKAPKQQQQKRL